MVHPIEDSGCFTKDVPDFMGQHVKAADKDIKAPKSDSELRKSRIWYMQVLSTYKNDLYMDSNIYIYIFMYATAFPAPGPVVAVGGCD